MGVTCGPREVDANAVFTESLDVSEVCAG